MLDTGYRKGGDDTLDGSKTLPVNYSHNGTTLCDYTQVIFKVNMLDFITVFRTQQSMETAKWSKIHRGKAIEDGKKSMRVSKAVNEIIAAARKGGSDPITNAALASALRSAKTLDIPKDNITAALAKAAGPTQAEDSLVANTYEALGPGNFPMIIETLSDSATRTAKNVKLILKDKGGRVAPVAYAFRKIGKIVLRPREGATHDQVYDDVIESGAEELGGTFNTEDPGQTELEITTSPSTLSAVQTALTSSPQEHIILESGFEYIPADPEAPLPELNKEDEEQVEKLCKALSEDPDVDVVWTLRGRWEEE
ncbi:hypothetical protein FRC05_006718 [Tulasnella sp. 425]|nr:hypothetical protein FRC05_006718 [Tulasnella sp. 425]